MIAIAGLTLVPGIGDPATGGGFTWCLGCGDLGTLDIINNVLLFVPFGAALAAHGRRLGSLTAIGIAFSTGIELLQVAIAPGRSGSFGDILSNSVGTALGGLLVSTRESWLAPHGVTRRVLAGATTGAALIVMIATADLLSPAVPVTRLYGQWTPRWAGSVPFAGQLHAVDVNDRALPDDVVPWTTEYGRSVSEGSLRVRADITSGTPPVRGLAPVVRVVNAEGEQFVIGQRPNDFIFSARLRSKWLRLRTLTVSLPSTVRESGEHLLIKGGIDRRQTLYLSTEGPSGRLSRQLDLTVGLGWAFFLPAKVVLGRWTSAANGLWLALVALPMGFYAAVPGRGLGVAERLRLQVAAVVWPLAALTVGLAIGPRLVGAAGSPWSEWVGALSGLTAGLLLARRRR